MAYRAIHTKIWDDPWFLEELGPDGKLLFFYLCTNGATNILGLYELSLRKAAGETGLPLDRVQQLLHEFEDAEKIATEGYWIWVRNLMRYNAENMNSPTVKVHIEKALADIPDDMVVKANFCRYYKLPIPYVYPMDTAPEHRHIHHQDSTSSGQHHQQDTDADAPETHDDDASDDDDAEPEPKDQETLVNAAVAALLERNWNAGEKKAAEFVHQHGAQYIVDMCDHAKRVGLEAGWIRAEAGAFTPGQKWESAAERRARLKNKDSPGATIGGIIESLERWI